MQEGGGKKRSHDQTYVPSQRDKEMEEQVEILNVSVTNGNKPLKGIKPQNSVCYAMVRMLSVWETSLTKQRRNDTSSQ